MAQIRSFRAEVEARVVAGDRVRMWTSADGLRWTITAHGDADFTLSCLNRTVWLKPLTVFEDLAGHLEPWRSLLQAAGLAVGAEHDRVEALLKNAGVGHVVRLGSLQTPSVGWRNKGVDLLEILMTRRREEHAPLR
jgi:hypothetical protein